MSLISKQIDELRAYAKDSNGELAKLINDAADTIEVLSAKLYASNMERSSQYYNDGWIPCSKRLPDDGRVVLWCNEHGSVFTSAITVRVGKSWAIGKKHRLSEIVAWMPLPEPYKTKENEL